MFRTDTLRVQRLKGLAPTSFVLRIFKTGQWATVPYCPISAGDHRKYKLEEGDIVVARTGNSTGENYLFRGGRDVVFASYLIRFRVNRTLADPRFVWYNLRSCAWRSFIEASKTGSAQAGANARVLGQFSMSLPPLREQETIAAILGALDDKIELNRRMNRTLEAMAQAIFKSWFVDFDPVRAKAAGQHPPGLSPEIAALFPDSFQDSELGEIPRGWSVGTLGAIAHEVRDSVNPSQIEENCPYIALEHIPKRCIALDSWGVANGVASGKLRFRRGDILFGKLRPYFHKVGPAPIDGVCSTDIVVARPKRPCWYGIMAGYLTDDAFVAFSDRGSAGTKMPRTNWRDMASYAIAVPGSQLADRHSRLVISLMEKINAGIVQSRILAVLRDALLPKLISGEFRIPDAERLVERYVR